MQPGPGAEPLPCTCLTHWSTAASAATAYTFCKRSLITLFVIIYDQDLIWSGYQVSVCMLEACVVQAVQVGKWWAGALWAKRKLDNPQICDYLMLSIMFSKKMFVAYVHKNVIL